MKTLFWGITWARIDNLWITGCVLLTIPLLWYTLVLSLRSVALLVSPRWQERLLLNYSSLRVYAKTVLLIIGFVAAGLAVLQPQWGTREQIVEQEGRELFIALDISRSMLAADVKPTRLAFAKAKIKQLVSLLHAERVGLLVFSGDALIQCPLTRDAAAFNLFLDTVDAETISSGTTALAKALQTIVNMFAGMPTRKNKIVVMFTDGEDFSGDLSQVKAQAKKENIHIFTYGIGTQEGAPVPIVNEQGQAIGHQKDGSGKVVFTRLNEPMLQALAQQSGGRYISPTQSQEDIQSLARTIEQYEKESLGDDKELETLEDRYPFFLAVTFICFLCEWLL